MANTHLKDVVWGVESHAIEMGVTLLVRGVVVTGFLTPYSRYGRWAKEVMGRAMAEGGSSALPSIPMSAISPKEQAEIVAGWKALAGDKDVRDYQELGADMSYFCVRNAQIQSGPAFQWISVPYLVVSTDSVDAFVPLHQPQAANGGDSTDREM